MGFGIRLKIYIIVFTLLYFLYYLIEIYPIISKKRIINDFFSMHRSDKMNRIQLNELKR